MSSKSCCSRCHGPGESPQSFYVYINGTRTEFLCCGEKRCALKQLDLASSGCCCLAGCSNSVDLDYTFPTFAKADICSSGQLGCPEDCQKHIVKGAIWLFCGKSCQDKMRNTLYGAKDSQLGVVTRIQVCSGCKKRYVNKPKLQRCGRCKLAMYCNRDCQLKHWRAHKNNCREPPENEKKKE